MIISHYEGCRLSHEDINNLLVKRSEYRKNKQWTQADDIAKILNEKEIVISDNKEGPSTYCFRNKLFKSSEGKTTNAKEEVLENVKVSKGRHSKVKNKKRKKTKNRGEMFSLWLIEKYGKDAFAKGVLDVAGGKGHVSYHLCKNSIKCCVIDPMPLKLSKSKTKEIIRNRKTNIEEKINLNEKNNLSSSSDLDLVNTNQIENKLIRWSVECEKDNRLLWLDIETVKDKLNFCTLDDIVSTAKYNLDELNLSHYKNLFERQSEEIIKLISTTGFLVGLHPDQATEEIVDLGLQYKIPFAVVPCCVYPSLFPNRLDKSNQQVRTYDQFLDYLQNKSCEIKREKIETIAGPNNICLFYIPN